MKKIYKIFSLVIISVIIISLLNFVNATDTKVDVSEDTIRDDVYQIGEDVSITKNVSGSVYIIAEKISLENISIEGNVFLIAKEIDIKNTYISGSAYIIGEEVELNSLIQDLYLIANKVELGDSSYIVRTARIGGETVNISGLIDRDCYVDAENLTVNDDTEIAGTLEYTTSEGATIGENAVITNVKENIKEEVKKDNKTITSNFSVYDFLSSLLKVTIVAGILILAFNERIKQINKINFSEFIKSLSIGSLLFFVIPVISIILMLTLIGFGLGILLMSIYAVVLFISTVTVSLIIASNLIKEYSKTKLLGVTILIYIAYKLLSLVPVLGGLLVVIFVLTGLGYIARIISNKKKKEDVVEIL